jgi:uncharacterized protein YbjT (DUF2867 family)
VNNILILGGSGFVGRSVCDKLVARSGGAGGQIVVPSRRPARAKHLQLLPTVRLVEADVHDAAQLRQLVQGCDAVINLVAILHGSAAAFEQVHVELPRKLAAACSAAGVRRVVHVSALGLSDAAPSHYLRSKAAGEVVLKAAKLDLTLLRPSVIFGEHDHFMNLFASLQAVAPLVPLAGANARFQPVWVQDVAAALVACLDQPVSIGQTYECAGPELLTLKQIVQLAGRLSGHERPVFGLPDALARLQAAFMERMPGTPLMSRDNLDSMKVPNVATGGLPGLQALGIEPAALSGVAPDYLSPGRGLARLDRWRARHAG